MFFLNGKLKRWHKAGIISETQQAAIKSFEKENQSGRFLKGLFGLGGFAVLAGILALIGSNWHEIPDGVKLTVHVLLNVFAALCVYHFHTRGREISRELSVLALMGLTLTLIALTGQVFQLDGTVAAALVLWMVLTTPFVLYFGQGLLSLLPWLMGFVTALLCGISEVLSDLQNENLASVVFIGIAIFLPLAFLHLSGAIRRFNKPPLQSLLFYTGLIAPLVLASFAAQGWYDLSMREFMASAPVYTAVVGLFAAGALSLPFLNLYDESADKEEQKYLRLILAGALATAALPFVFYTVDADILAALTFIAFWVFTGWAAQTIGWPRLVTISLILAAIRIYIVYIELFGSLLQTGFGLIFSGLVLIAMAMGVRKLNTRLVRNTKPGAA